MSESLQERTNPDKKLLEQANVAFRYLVEIGEQPHAAFTECTLPVLDWEIEEFKEGGLNTYVHQLPGRRKSARLKLKYGVCKDTLVDWCIAVMGEKFERRTITIRLIDAKKNPLMSWDIEGAYPIKWEGPALKSDTTAIAIQSIEFACHAVTLNKPESGIN